MIMDYDNRRNRGEVEIKYRGIKFFASFEVYSTTGCELEIEVLDITTKDSRVDRALADFIDQEYSSISYAAVAEVRELREEAKRNFTP